MSSRRVFLKTISRSVMAAGLAGMSGYLVLKDTSGKACDFDFPCNGCKRFPSCNDPKARDFQKSNNNGGDR
jgi:hypothetical protein